MGKSCGPESRPSGDESAIAGSGTRRNSGWGRRRPPAGWRPARPPPRQAPGLRSAHSRRLRNRHELSCLALLPPATKKTSLQGAALTLPPLPGRQRVDRFGQPVIALGHFAGVVAGEAEIDAVPDACELGVVVGFLGVQRDSRQEGEGLAEVLELEASDERLAALVESPACGRFLVHRAPYGPAAQSCKARPPSAGKPRKRGE